MQRMHIKKDSKVRKPYRCYCGKSYCTNQGLKNHCTHSHKNESLTAVTTNTGEVLQVPANQLSSSNSNSQLSDNNKSSTTPVTRSFENEGIVQVSGTTAPSTVNNPIAVTGQIIKGGSAATTKGTTTISSINLTGLVAASGGKIALKALPNGQLLLSQPLEGKLATLVKSDSKHDFSLDDGKNHLVQLKTDGFQQIELSKLLQSNSKLSQHQVAVTTSTLSVAIPASSFNSLKGSQRTGLSSSAMLARALKNQLASTPTGITSVLGSLDNQPENMLGGQGVILGVTMEEGTLVDNGDGTLSELSVIE